MAKGTSLSPVAKATIEDNLRILRKVLDAELTDESDIFAIPSSLDVVREDLKVTISDNLRVLHNADLSDASVEEVRFVQMATYALKLYRMRVVDYRVE